MTELTYREGDVAVYTKDGKSSIVRIMRTIPEPSADVQYPTHSTRSIVPFSQLRPATLEEQLAYWKALAFALSRA